MQGFVLQGDGLASNGEVWKYDQRSPSGDLIDIRFHPLSDRGPLEAMQPTTTNETNTGSGADNNASAPEPAPAPDSGNTATGTVRVVTAPEAVQLQGLDRTPNGEDEAHRFAVFVFDSPIMFTAQSSGNNGAIQERKVAMVRIGPQTPYAFKPTGFDLAGQQLTLPLHPQAAGPLGYLDSAWRSRVLRFHPAPIPAAAIRRPDPGAAKTWRLR